MEWQDEYSVGMGTAMEGPQQGQVRLHIEIAPDGKIAKVSARTENYPDFVRSAR